MFRVDTACGHVATGDYYLEGYESVVVIERKGSIDELYKNLFTPDRRRQGRAAKRLVELAMVPVLLLDFDATTMFGTWKAKQMEQPGCVLDATYRFAARFGLHLWWHPGGHTTKSRERLGEAMLRFLWSYVWEYLNGSLSKRFIERRHNVTTNGYSTEKRPGGNTNHPRTGGGNDADPVAASRGADG